MKNSDDYLSIECPRCDAPMVVLCSYGRFDIIVEPCPDNCRETYSEEEYGAVKQDAEDQACFVEYDVCEFSESRR